MKWDRFDLLVIAASAVLLVGATAIGITGENSESMPVQARTRAASPDSGIYPRLSAARRLLDSGQAKEAADSLNGLLKEYPAEAEIHALLGQAYARLLNYPLAMKEFRQALLLDPDYVDRKSDKFIGRRIKATVKEGMSESKAALAKDPHDLSARAALQDSYYLSRMLAGGCE